MPSRGPIKSLLRRTFRALVGLYFRRIEVIGQPPARSLGGRVFVSNHVNALIDPILVLTHAPCDISPLAKSTLWKMPGLTWLLDTAGAVPVVRRRDDPQKPAGSNDEMFSKVSKHLANGGNILVFPEGTSHNEPHMLRLKTGAARMLAQARREGGQGLSHQAVGLEFDARATFRSSAVVAYGPVRTVTASPEDEAAFVDEVTRVMAQDLAALVVEGATWDERRLILRVAELYRNEGARTGFAAAVELAQQVEVAREVLAARDPARLERVRVAVHAYFDELARFGTSDEIFVSGHGDRTSVVARVLLFLLLPLAPLGIVLYALPYQLPRLVARRTDEVDQHSTLKLATGLVAYPAFAAVYLALAIVFAREWPALLAALVVVIFVSPFAALTWMERTNELLGPVRAALSPSHLARLAKLRAAALAEVEAARAVTATTDAR